MNEISITKALLAFVLLATATLCVAIRWRVIASAVARPIRYVEALTVVMIGGALDQMWFSMSGDAYRIWWLSKGASSLARAIAGVVLDRVAGVLGIVLLVLAFLPRLAGLDTSGGLVWVPTGIAATVLCGFGALVVLDQLPLGLSRNRWLQGIGVLSSSARRVFFSPVFAVPAVSVAVSIHVIVCACISVLAWSLGIGLGLIPALTVVPTVMLISLLPISIGGWGVREGAMVVALGLCGVDSTDAVLISVMFGLCAAAIGIAGGLLWLLGLAPAAIRPELKNT